MKRVDQVLSNWHVLFDNYNTSAQEFYDHVEAAVRAREVPEVSFSRHYFLEGGGASARRQYLRVERKFVAFDICASQYGRSYFFSWWLARLGPKYPFLYLLAFLVVITLVVNVVGDILGGPSNFLAWIVVVSLILYGLGLLVRQRVVSSEEEIIMVPLVGRLYVWMFNPITYYSLDTATMFRDSIHSAVLEVVDELTNSTGLRALTDGERKPVMSDFINGGKSP